MLLFDSRIDVLPGAWALETISHMTPENWADHNSDGKIEATYDQEMDQGRAAWLLEQAFGILMNYENSGRREQGWQTYWALTSPEHWTYTDPQVSEYLISQRNYYKAQYKVNP